jgi:hypothetical protein
VLNRVIIGENTNITLAQVRALPNPSTGNFNLQFSTEPGRMPRYISLTAMVASFRKEN